MDTTHLALPQDIEPSVLFLVLLLVGHHVRPELAALLHRLADAVDRTP